MSSLSGLDALTEVGGNFSNYYNFLLEDCCSIEALLNNGGVQGATVIFFNKYGCGSVAEIDGVCTTGPLLLAFDEDVSDNESLEIAKVANPVNDDSKWLEQELVLFPNPAHDNLTIQIENPAGGEVALMMLNSLGQAVYSTKLTGERLNHVISLADTRYVNGDYFVRVKTDTKVMTKQLVIIK